MSVSPSGADLVQASLTRRRIRRVRRSGPALRVSFDVTLRGPEVRVEPISEFLK
jgi:hypothetical protein